MLFQINTHITLQPSLLTYMGVMGDNLHSYRVYCKSYLDIQAKFYLTLFL